MVDMSNERLPPKTRARVVNYAEAEHSLMTVIRSNQSLIKELDDGLAIALHNQKIEQEVNNHTVVSERVQSLRDQIKERQDVMEGQRDKHRALADINSKIRRFLDTLPADVNIDEAPRVNVKLKPGLNHLQQVAELRVSIMRLIAERAQVERTGLPKDEIKAQIKKLIVEAAMKGRPSIVVNHEKAEVLFLAKVENAFTPTQDLFATLAWFDPDHLEAALLAQVEEMPTPKHAMTPADKRVRLSEIKQELTTLEREECALIDDAADQGIVIEPRANVDMKAFLGIVVTKRPKAAHNPKAIADAANNAA